MALQSGNIKCIYKNKSVTSASSYITKDAKSSKLTSSEVLEFPCQKYDRETKIY